MTTINTSSVPQSQLDAVDRYLDGQTGKHFCLVTNSRNDVDERGDLIRYRVGSHKGKLTCTCKAGSQGRNCWHKRAALAYVEHLRAEQQERSKIERLVAQGFDRQTAIRVVYAKSTVPTQEEMRQAEMLQANRNKGFSLMR